MNPEKPVGEIFKMERFPGGKKISNAEGEIVTIEFDFPQKKFSLRNRVVIKRAYAPVIEGETGTIIKLFEPGTEGKTSDVIQVELSDGTKISSKPTEIDVIAEE